MFLGWLNLQIFMNKVLKAVAFFDELEAPFVLVVHKQNQSYGLVPFSVNFFIWPWLQIENWSHGKDMIRYFQAKIPQFLRYDELKSEVRDLYQLRSWYLG